MSNYLCLNHSPSKPRYEEIEKVLVKSRSCNAVMSTPDGEQGTILKKVGVHVVSVKTSAAYNNILIGAFVENSPKKTGATPIISYRLQSITRESFLTINLTINENFARMDEMLEEWKRNFSEHVDWMSLKTSDPTIYPLSWNIPSQLEMAQSIGDFDRVERIEAINASGLIYSNDPAKDVVDWKAITKDYIKGDWRLKRSEWDIRDSNSVGSW